MVLAANLDDRHPDTVTLAGRFTADPPTAEPAATVAARCRAVATMMIGELPDGPDLTAGLRHLLAARGRFLAAAGHPVDPPTGGTSIY